MHFSKTARSMACAAMLFFLASSAVTASESISTEVVIDGLDHPWAMAFLPGGDMLISERSGQLLRLDRASGKTAPVTGVPRVDAGGQGGLLDVVLHPRFRENRWVYFTYAGQSPDGDKNATHLARGQLNAQQLENVDVLFVATPYVDSSKHFGSRIVFSTPETLFLTVGERGERDRAQDIEDHNGSVLRLHADGSIPDDNPFVGKKKGLPAIYSYGHRNPQGATLHPRTGRLWIHEHGPRGGDEINLPEPGKNYGWPEITYGREYWGPKIGPTHKPGMEQPIHHWTPSIAPSGMTFYDGERFPQWRGNLFVGALAHRHLARLTIDGTKVVAEEKLLTDKDWRIRDVEQGPDGFLYVLTDDDDGKLVRLAPYTR